MKVLIGILAVVAFFDFPGNATAAHYTVQKGDTLSEIAEELGHTTREIALVNEIENPDLIFPDQDIVFISEKNLEFAAMWCERKIRQVLREEARRSFSNLDSLPSLKFEFELFMEAKRCIIFRNIRYNSDGSDLGLWFDVVLCFSKIGEAYWKAGLIL